MGSPVLCSTVIATIGRDSLSRAVKSVLSQNLSGGTMEVIVVNDSGQPLETADWMADPNVRLLHTNRRNRSVARNTGAATARGHYLHFLDDDDWMLPGAFASLEAAASNSTAGWIHGGFRLVDNSGATICEISPVESGNCLVQLLASEWLPLQASWIETTQFFRLGGFAPLPSLLGGYEDIDLSRQAALMRDFTFTPALVACIRFGDQGSTTDYENLVAQNRQSREKTLNTAGVFGRLIASAARNPEQRAYWHGRIVYYYLASLGYNVRRRRITTVFSRALFMLAAFGLAGRGLVSRSFWAGVSRPHVNRVSAGVGSAAARLYSSTRWKT